MNSDSRLLMRIVLTTKKLPTTFLLPSVSATSVETLNVRFADTVARSVRIGHLANLILVRGAGKFSVQNINAIIFVLSPV